MYLQNFRRIITKDNTAIIAIRTPRTIPIIKPKEIVGSSVKSGGIPVKITKTSLHSYIDSKSSSYSNNNNSNNNKNKVLCLNWKVT